MTDNEMAWDAFYGILEDSWKSHWTDTTRDSYEVFLRRYGPEACMVALTKLVHAGARFRPSPGEIIGAMEQDPSAPTFDEMMEAVFAPGGIINPRVRREKGSYLEDELRQMRLDAQQTRMDEAHPLIGQFVIHKTLRWLGQLEINDPDWGEKRRADLKRDWEEWVRTADARGQHVRALEASGQRGELGKLRPLSELGIRPPKELQGE